MKYFIVTCLIVFGITLSFAPCFAQQTKIDSAKLILLKNETNAAANSGDYQKAATLAKALIDLGVRDSGMYYMTAIVLALSGNKEEGKRYYDTAIVKGYDPKETGMARSMLGLNTQTSKVNVDSAFAAIHADALQKAKTLPAGYTNAKLYQIYLEDQGERSLLIEHGMKESIDDGIAMQMMQNDQKRKPMVYAILPQLMKAGARQDLQAAGLLLQHGDDTTDYWNAHELAMRAIELGDSTARWLAAATLDRYLVKKGKPQLYGTQSHPNEKTGKYELYPVDPSITDAERAKWNVPPLKDALKMVQFAYGH